VRPPRAALTLLDDRGRGLFGLVRRHPEADDGSVKAVADIGGDGHGVDYIPILDRIKAERR
jgi:hypothetical protein